MQRRSAGKRLRMDEEQQQQYYGQDQDAEEEEEAFDPIAFYQQQRSEMLIDSAQHVQASQIEIQQAQLDAQQRDQMHQEPSHEGGGRRSRRAAAAASAALSMMDMDEIGRTPARETSPTPSPARATRPRGARGGFSSARGGRGRPRGSTAAVMSRRRLERGDPSPEDTGPIRRGRPKKAVADIMPEDESSLYFIIRNGKASLQQVVDDWIDSYKVDRDAALLTLMQFFISASGCRGRITPQMQASMDHADIIRRMTEEFEEESGEYPLVTAGQFWKKFRGNFCDFIQLLVKQCQYSIIYDQHLMDNVISLLTQLSDSQVRAFRHTATLAAMKLMSALVDVALTVSINLENTQRQYDAEQQKSVQKRASDRLEQLMTRRKELEENTEEIKNMLTYMFKAVFVHRYRDTLPEIRSICMYEIGQWMKKYHTNFLDDTYLKYIGWTIHDKVGDVRLKCLQTLQPLYGSEDLKGKLELFTSKFKDRIVDMTLDKEFDVSVEAVKLVISIFKYHREMLTDQDCERIYELVYCSHRAVAQAAGEFLNVRLFTPDEEMDPDIRTKRGKKRLENTPHQRDLVDFFIESELHEHGAYLVDSLIESNPMMKDWECMTDLLLEEPGPREEPLNDRQEASLIEIMVCCIKQAASGEPPVGRGPTRKVMSAKELKQVSDDKQALTAHFIQTLPPLLKKYLPDHEKIANLMVIPQYFDLEIYTTSRQEKNLETLLSLIQETVDKHNDNEVLDSCAKTLETLCDEKFAIFSRCDVARSRLLDLITNKYKEINDDISNLLIGGEELNEDDEFNLKSALKKVECFYTCHNLTNYGIWQSLFDLIAKYKEAMSSNKGEIGLPEEAAKSALCACYFGLLWDLNYIQGTIERESTSNAVNSLKQKVQKYMEAMQEVLMGSSLLLREEAFLCICDLLIGFSRRVAFRNTVLAPLAFQANRTMSELLNEFVQNHVFVEDDEEDQDDHSKIKELHKRRNFLASFCKLIIYNVVPTKNGADVFKHYVHFYNHYGDIIKATLGKARENNKVNCAKSMAESLIIKFKEIRQLQNNESVINRATVEFHSLKELAKRFALSFGLDALKNREAVTSLHREGILLAVNPLENPDDPTAPPPNLSFLEILTEFSNKLLKQDKKVVLNYLDKRIEGATPSSQAEDWQPLLVYRNSLVHGEGEVPVVPSKRPYARKRKAYGSDDDDDDDDADYV